MTNLIKSCIFWGNNLTKKYRHFRLVFSPGAESTFLYSFILLQHGLEELPTQLWFYYVPTKQAAVKSFNIAIYIPSKSDRIPSRWSFTESSDILFECRGHSDSTFSQKNNTQNYPSGGQLRSGPADLLCLSERSAEHG